MPSQRDQLEMTNERRFDILVNPSLDDWKRCVDQSFETEQWRLSYSDYETWKTIYGDQFHLTIAKDPVTGQVVGFVLFAIIARGQLASLGSFYVSPDYRKMGIGTQLFRKAIDGEYAKGTNIALNAASYMTPFFASHGFVNLVQDWYIDNIRADFANVDITKLPDIPDRSIRITDSKNVDMEKLTDFDRTITGGIDRRRFFQKWVEREDAIATIAVDVKGQVVGFCIIRHIVNNRLLVCPWYANNREIAQALLKSNLLKLTERFDSLHFAIPSVNISALDIVNQLTDSKAVHVYQTRTHFTRAIVQPAIDRVYNITAQGLTFI